MSSADKTLVRRLVQQAVGKAVKTDGKDLGEVFPPYLPLAFLPCKFPAVNITTLFM
jgi:hypothetical protein